jgi:hypothetical protein
MNRNWIERVALTSLMVLFCASMPLSTSTYSQGPNQSDRKYAQISETRGDSRVLPFRLDEIKTAGWEFALSSDFGGKSFVPAAPETLKVTRTDADRSDEMPRDLSTVTPELPRAGEEPNLAEPPRLLDINRIRSASPTTTNAPENPYFEQSSPGPALETERGSTYAGISHKETIVPGLQPPNDKFIVRTAPPDTVGAVGDDYYVQWVNTSFAVFRKKTGELIYGPAQGRTLWKGFDNGPCEKANDGDPIVQYDKIHKRWIMAQFAISKRPDPLSQVELPIPPYYQCIAVSTTSNPLGKYRRYRFQYSLFNDYPKIGVWTDGYYVTFNMFNDPNSGAMVCAYDQDVMLGLPTQSGPSQPARTASQQCAQLDKRYTSLLPADIDGTIKPPDGAPNYLVNLDPNNGSLNFWRFKVDWRNQNNSQLTGPFPVAGVEEYEVPCLNSSRYACITQPVTSQKLESLADRLMYRLAYRRFADGHESLLLNHTVAQHRADSSVAAIRWYELRDLASSPTVYQSGTFGPDANHRWIGSIAMDRIGNIGLAYSVSGASLSPSVYYAGRSANDSQKGRLGKEVEIVPGGGSQTCLLPNGQCDSACLKANGSCITNIARWGDYSSLTVDPADDCTMWHTTEYLKSTGGFNWSTIIYSFRFKGCVSSAPPHN